MLLGYCEFSLVHRSTVIYFSRNCAGNFPDGYVCSARNFMGPYTEIIRKVGKKENTQRHIQMKQYSNSTLHTGCL